MVCAVQPVLHQPDQADVGWMGDRDCLKNIRAAGGGRLKRHCQTYPVNDPRVFTKAEAAPHITGLGRFVFARSPFEKAVLLRRA
jgi:hypothetical protein